MWSRDVRSRTWPTSIWPSGHGWLSSSPTSSWSSRSEFFMDRTNSCISSWACSPYSSTSTSSPSSTSSWPMKNSKKLSSTKSVDLCWNFFSVLETEFFLLSVLLLCVVIFFVCVWNKRKLNFKLFNYFLKMGQTRPLFGLFSFFFTTQGQI